MSVSESSQLSISQSIALEASGAYDILVESIKELSTATDAKTAFKTIGTLLRSIVEKLSTPGECLLLYTSKIFDKDYIYAHSLNVCLLSVKIGMRLQFDGKRLMRLGFIALTHAGKDIGLPKDMSTKIQHDEELNEIVRLSDIYDALTHPPAYRHAVIPRETLETILGSDHFFDRHLMKILIDEVSLYPHGSGVQLSSNEVGRVIKVNKGLPLRPVVKVNIDRQGNYLDKGRTLDLSKDNLIYVLRPVPEEEMGRLYGSLQKNR